MRQGQLSEPTASSGPAAMLLADSRSPSSIPRRSPCPDRYPLPQASVVRHRHPSFCYHHFPQQYPPYATIHSDVIIQTFVRKLISYRSTNVHSRRSTTSPITPACKPAASSRFMISGTSLSGTAASNPPEVCGSNTRSSRQSYRRHSSLRFSQQTPGSCKPHPESIP